MASEYWIAKWFIVTLDFDGCIAVGDHVKIKYAKIYDEIDITSETSTRETYPAGPKRYIELMDIVASKHILEYYLDPLCKSVLNKLYQEGFRFAVVTSRSKETGLLQAAEEFCKYHKLPISYFYSTGRKKGETEYVPKDLLVKKLRSRAMIDDTLYKLWELKDAPAYLFWLKRPWSLHEKFINEMKGRIIPINDWREFYTNLLHIRGIHEAICYYNKWPNIATRSKDIFNFLIKNQKLCEKYLKDYQKRVA